MQYDRLIEHLSYTIETDRFGTTRYRNRDGQLHRTHGPAIIYSSGTKAWYQNGLLHRTDGPAVVFPTGEQHWFLNGEEFCEEDFRMRVATVDYREP